jgi:hypothetical protein
LGDLARQALHDCAQRRRIVIAIAFLLAAASGAPAAPLVAEMQRIESRRNAAIKSGDLVALESIYAAEFNGIAGNGTRVDLSTLFTIFKRNAGGDFIADSQVLAAREVRPGVVAVEGRLKLTSSSGMTISDSHYLHVFRKNGRKWEMIEGAAVPIAPPRP